MAGATMKAALRSIGRLLGGGSVSGLSDGELIGRFARGRDEAAFAALMARHGPMVLATARAVLRDPHDAEDAFQAAFLVLARRAGSIREGDSLGGWLHRVARRVAIRANVEAGRRRERVRQVGEALALRAPSEIPSDDGPAIHAEVDRLPDSLRRPLILCDLEGLTRREAAHQLGWTEGAVRGRLARARALLRSRLARRGLAPASAPIVVAVPSAWLEAAGRAFATPGGGSAAASALASAVARGLVVARVRLVGTVALLGLVAAGGLASGFARAVPPPTSDAPRAMPAPAPAPKAESPPPADPEAGVVAYSGRVVDPQGRPFAGARVYLDYFRVSQFPPMTYPPSPRHRATSGPDGRFRFSVARGDFLAPFEPWPRAAVVAVAEGFGLGLSDSDEPDSGHEVTVRLAPDDAPLLGRVLDLEGRPVAGVTVRVDLIQAPSGGSLTPWLEAGRGDDRRTLYELKHEYLKKEIRNDPDAGPIAPTTTGPDGRFRIAGIGRERIAFLIFEGPTIRSIQARAMTRPGEAARLSHQFGGKNPLLEVYHPSPADYLASPTRPIEGVVRDKDTGEPISGASIQSYKLADQNLGNNRFLRATTDARGRFRLVGMPRGPGNEVYVIPPADRPHFPAKLTLGDAPGLAPLAVEVALKRGLWLRGRLTDAATGKPIRAEVAYHVAADNPRLADLPGFREISLNGDYSFNTPSEADGTFRVAALPGKGLVVADAVSIDYLGVDREEAGIEGPEFVPYAYRLGDALARVDLPEGAEPPPVALALHAARKLAGSVLDPEGRPLADARIGGLSDIGYWEKARKDPTFTVHGLRPPRPPSLANLLAAPNLRAAVGRLKPVPPRVLVFRHDGRKLAGSLDVRGDEPGPLSVKLEPWATVVGRLVDADGRPRPRVPLRPHVADKPRGGGGEIEHDPGRLLTDADGRFRVDGLVAGLAYRLYHEDPSNGVQTDRFLPVPPARVGATVDLGDVREAGN